MSDRCPTAGCKKWLVAGQRLCKDHEGTQKQQWKQEAEIIFQQEKATTPAPAPMPTGEFLNVPVPYADEFNAAALSGDLNIVKVLLAGNASENRHVADIRDGTYQCLIRVNPECDVDGKCVAIQIWQFVR
jgi:hypothetical protein